MSLELAAKFLGVDYKPYHKYPVNFMGDDELCMALLRRAAERGLDPDLRHFKSLNYWRIYLWLIDDPSNTDAVIETGPTPLAAVLAAVAALEGQS
jgi:hypothetical protein